MKHFIPHKSTQSIGIEEDPWKDIYLAGDIYTNSTDNILIFGNGNSYSWHTKLQHFFKKDKAENIEWLNGRPPPFLDTSKIIFPVNNSTEIDCKPVIEIEPPFVFDQEIIEKQVQIATDSTFNTIVWDSGEIPYTPNNQTTVTSFLNSNKKHFARQKIKGDQTGWTGWSESVTFTTTDKIMVIPGIYYGDEAFGFTVDIPGGDLTYSIPLHGMNFNTNAQDQPYDWNINWGDGIIENKSGISSNVTTNCITHTYSTAKKYTIIIRPNVDNYGWMRAWLYSGTSGPANLPANKKKISSIEYVTNKSFLGSSTSTGTYYMSLQFYGADIIYPANEVETVKEDTITSIGNNFRYSQYNSCAKLITTLPEKIPNVTSIGNAFRGYQYGSCPSLSTTATEVLPNTLLTIGDNFRYYQYTTSGITSATSEFLPNGVTIIGANYRQSQYEGCTKLLVTAIEVFPNTITKVGGTFRGFQYKGCSALTTISADEALSNTLTTAGGISFRIQQFMNCTSLIHAANESCPNSITSIEQAFRFEQYRNCKNLITTGQEAMSDQIPQMKLGYRCSQYEECTSLLIGNHIHLRMDDFLNQDGGNYSNTFAVNSPKTTPDTISKYKDKNGNIYPITNLTPTGIKDYCINRTGIAGYSSLSYYWVY